MRSFLPVLKKDISVDQPDDFSHYPVIFDMDGVIIDSEPIQLAAYNQVLQPWHLQLSEADFIHWCVGRKARDNFAFLCKKFQLAASVEDLLSAKDEAYQALLRHRIVPMPGLLALLKTLTRLRCPLAVASSSRLPDIELVLQSLAIQQLFTVIVSGQEVTSGKPAPDIFLEAARRLRVSPEQCAVFEDTQTGVEAAVGARMFCIAVPNHFTASQDFSRAQARLHSLEEAEALLFSASAAPPYPPWRAARRQDVSASGLQQLYSPYDKHKLLAHSERIAHLLRGVMVDPITVDVEPTNLCNHDCFWCYNRDFRFAYPVSLTQRTLLSLIDSFRDTGVKGVIFSGGGEPLLHPSIDQALYKGADIGLDCCLYTNGVLLDEHLEAISASCRSLNISLDSGSGATHVLMHRPHDGKDDWEHIINNIRLLKKRAPHVFISVSYVTHLRNYTEIHTVARHLNSIGVDLLHIKPMVKYKSHLNAALEEELHKQIELAKEEIAVTLTGVNLTSSRLYPVQCRATPLKGLVAADGKLYVCCRRREPEYCLGSLEEQDFWSIWRSEKHRSLLQNIVPARCGECPQVEYNDILDHVFDADELQRNFI